MWNTAFILNVSCTITVPLQELCVSAGFLNNLDWHFLHNLNLIQLQTAEQPICCVGALLLNANPPANKPIRFVSLAFVRETQQC